MMRDEHSTLAALESRRKKSVRYAAGYYCLTSLLVRSDNSLGRSLRDNFGKCCSRFFRQNALPAAQPTASIKLQHQRIRQILSRINKVIEVRGKPTVVSHFRPLLKFITKYYKIYCAVSDSDNDTDNRLYMNKHKQ